MKILDNTSGRMNRNETPERLSKEQSYAKRNTSSVLSSDTPNNKNNSKTVPDKPFNVNGKDIYVIDSTTDTDNPDVQIISRNPNQYEDRSAFLGRTSWPESGVGHLHEMLNGTFPEQQNSNYSKPARTSTRSKSINPLNHINQDSRNVKREVSPGGHSKYSSSRRKFLLFVFN